jgi:hypothetical protein
MTKKAKWLAAGLLVLAMAAKAGVIIYNQFLVNESALAYNNTYVLNIQNVGINAISAAATYSSATIPTASFTDGSQSTGSISISNFAGLVAAQATDNITVVSTSGLARATLSIPGFVLREGSDWSGAGLTVNQAAASLGLALSKVYPPVMVSVAGNVIYTTAPVGSNYNALAMQSSQPSLLTVATPNFTGGQDNAVMTINGVRLTQGANYTAATSNNATASSLAAAINASPQLSRIVTATPSSNVVNLVSKNVGSLMNFALTSSAPSAMAPSSANMINGTNSATQLGSAVINIPFHNLTTALPVLYGSTTQNLGGLTNQTTYYPIIIDPSNIELASSQSNALLGVPIVITSSSSQVTPDQFTLAPLPISGTPSFKWQVSNDNVFWNDLSVSSVTVNSYSSPAASTIWSFGYIGTQYLRLNVVAPTTGGLNLHVKIIGTN